MNFFQRRALQRAMDARGMFGFQHDNGLDARARQMSYMAQFGGCGCAMPVMANAGLPGCWPGGQARVDMWGNYMGYQAMDDGGVGDGMVPMEGTMVSGDMGEGAQFGAAASPAMQRFAMNRRAVEGGLCAPGTPNDSSWPDGCRKAVIGIPPDGACIWVCKDGSGGGGNTDGPSDITSGQPSAFTPSMQRFAVNRRALGGRR